MLKHLLLLFLFLYPFLSISQSTLKYETGTLGFLSSDSETTPHWFIYNRNGLINSKGNENLSFIDADYSTYFGKKWKIEVGVKAIQKFPLKDSYLQEAYFNFSFGKLKFIAGKEENAFLDYNEQISSGSLFVSSNARPIPRIGIGFYDYVNVPLTKGFVQIKGFLNQGILNDNLSPLYTRNALLHEKSAYIRSNNLTINPHFGIAHNVLFGGTLPNGTKIPVDYIATFFGKSSKKVGSVLWGEETNVAGGHFGLFDIGFNFNIEKLTIQTYLQKPISDRSGFIEMFRRNKDFIFGFEVKNNTSKFLKEFIYERIYTIWQSGPGIPDPYINGISGFNIDFSDLDKVLKDNYDIETEGVSKTEFWRIVRRKENYGYEYWGRDDYYNNGLYYQGLSYHNNAIGNSLMLTKNRILNINPLFDGDFDLFFVNNRISAHHLGFKGYLSKNIDYRLLLTYTNNLGTYAGLNKGRSNWDSMNPDSDYHYYFEDADYRVDGKNQFYTMLNTGYTFPKIPALKLNLDLGIDAGKLYHNYGILIGFQYSGSILSKD